jgi:hypothetical protein
MDPDVIAGVSDDGDLGIELLESEMLLESTQKSRAANTAGEGCDLHDGIFAASTASR